MAYDLDVNTTQEPWRIPELKHQDLIDFFLNFFATQPASWVGDESNLSQSLFLKFGECQVMELLDSWIILSANASTKTEMVGLPRASANELKRYGAEKVASCLPVMTDFLAVHWGFNSNFLGTT